MTAPTSKTRPATRGYTTLWGTTDRIASAVEDPDPKRGRPAQVDGVLPSRRATSVVSREVGDAVA
ncbi:hypothetical protein GCM10009749_05520 [Agromyces neolithicus]|uniref:Uncharacterized protein n=1 Tax=Agromyces neolithicus TaxID=269420 RepID=A0ABP4Y7R0_9MICO